MKAKRKYLIGLVLGLFLAISSLLGAYWLFQKPNFLLGKEAKVLIVPTDISLRSLEAMLSREGYIADLGSFHLLARLLRYDRKILPGAYQLQPNMSNWAAMKLLKWGRQVPIKLVLDHVYSQAELIARVTQNTGIRADELEKLLYDASFIGQFGFTLDNILSMFIPNTYQVYWTITAQEFLQKMFQAYQRFWNQARREQALKLGLTPIEVSILASIVQRETNKLEEAPIIAGIYINRLRKGMRLQACPTLLYAAGQLNSRRVLAKYRRIDSPYNTYLYAGLPPGPITIPTIAMLEAVLNMKQHHFFYFSAKEDFSGYHYFTRDFSEHKKNSQKYRRALNRARIYQ